MGISLVAYLCDVEALQQVCGAADVTLETQLFETLEDDGKWDDDDVRRALHEIVFGIQQDALLPRDYAAALEILCIHFGEQLDSDAFDSMHTAATSLLPNFDGLLNANPIPLPIPTGQSDGPPTIYHINSREAQRILERLLTEPQPKTTDPLGQEWIAEAFQDYRQWLTKACETSQDLFIFLY